MSLESASARREKRMVEQMIGGFRNAREAIVFGNTIESVVQDKVKELIKFRQHIAAPDSIIAVTNDWDGETILRVTFADISNQNTAMFILEMINKAKVTHEEINKCALNIINEVVRDKPQPQTIG